MALMSIRGSQGDPIRDFPGLRKFFRKSEICSPPSCLMSKGPSWESVSYRIRDRIGSPFGVHRSCPTGRGDGLEGFDLHDVEEGKAYGSTGPRADGRSEGIAGERPLILRANE